MAKDKEQDKETAKKAPEAKEAAKPKASAPKAETKSSKPASEKKAAAPKKKEGGKGSQGGKSPRRPLLGGTYAAKWGEIQPKWRLVDATNVPLGRLSTYIAQALRGKDRPTYTRSADTGDNVVVINAEKVVLTGKKLEQKKYEHHTNYPGGLKTVTAKEVLESNKPTRLVEWAVWRMLPKGHMGRQWYKKLWVYAGSQHPHAAQKPEAVKLPDLGFWERT